MMFAHRSWASLPLAGLQFLLVACLLTGSFAHAAEDGRHKQLIIGLREDSSYKVRLQAAVLLGRSGQEEAVDALLRALSEDPHYTVRAASATAIANLETLRGVTHLVRQAALDPEDFVRQEALRALARYPRTEAIPYAIAAYNGSDDVRVRSQAMIYLTEKVDPSIESVLIRALGDVDSVSRLARSKLSQQTPEVRMALLRRAVDNRDASVRRGAVEALTQVASKEATELVLSVYERDLEVDEVRDVARKGLRALRRFLPLERIINAAEQGGEKHERARSLKLLGVVGGPQAKSVLIGALEDGDRYLRGTAVMALADLGDPEVMPQLSQLLEDPSNQSFSTIIQHTLKQLEKIASARSK